MLFITAAVVVVGLFLFRGILPFVAGIVAWANWRILPGAFRRYQTRTAATRQAEKNKYSKSNGKVGFVVDREWKKLYDKYNNMIMRKRAVFVKIAKKRKRGLGPLFSFSWEKENLCWER